MVALYLPSEQFLAGALEADPALPHAGAEHGIVLTSPSHLVALLQTIRMGWRQQAITETAEQARREADALYERVQWLREHLAASASGANARPPWLDPYRSATRTGGIRSP
jgi:DNA recombination protein RmuC